MGMIKSGDKYLLHLTKSSCGACMENTLSIPHIGHAFWGLKIYHINQMTISVES
jgi:hypothetical protein